MRWAYGVTTVPSRLGELLPTTLASLRKAGFPEPRLFIDDCPDALNYWQLKLPMTVHWPKVNVTGNWLLGLLELYARDPNADRYALFQDDFVTYRNLRQYLERTPYPPQGYLNLLTFRGNEAVIKDKPVGWHEAYTLGDGHRYHGKRQQSGKGAVALVFSNQAACVLFNSNRMMDKLRDPHFGYRKVDGHVVQTMNEAGWREYVHNPSLVQHRGTYSTVERPEGKVHHVDALSFRGEDFDALELLPCSVTG